MFANAFKFAHMIVTTFYNGVDLRDKLKSESKMTPRFLAVGVGEMLLPRISMGKEELKLLR